MFGRIKQTKLKCIGQLCLTGYQRTTKILVERYSSASSEIGGAKVQKGGTSGCKSTSRKSWATTLRIKRRFDPFLFGFAFGLVLCLWSFNLFGPAYAGLG